jgi:hypothetical protein
VYQSTLSCASGSQEVRSICGAAGLHDVSERQQQDTREDRASSLSAHSRSRSQQRAIPRLAIDLLLDYGSCVRGRDADFVFFDKPALRRLRHALGGNRGLQVIDRWLNSYAVVADDGLLVTVGHRTHRFWRSWKPARSHPRSSWRR